MKISLEGGEGEGEARGNFLNEICKVSRSLASSREIDPSRFREENKIQLSLERGKKIPLGCNEL